MRYASVVTTSRFLETTAAVYRFISERSVHRADAVVSETHERSRSLTDNPRRGRVVAELGDVDVREVFVARGDYRLIYRVNDAQKTVSLLALWPSRKPLESDLLLDGE